MFKSIHLTGTEVGLQIDRNADSDIFTIRVNDFIKDEARSTSGHTVLKENNVLEVYLEIEEVKEIIQALQQILPED